MAHADVGPDRSRRLYSLTDALVRRVRPEAMERILWDREMTGLGLCIYPSGAKTWIIQHRVQRRTRRRTLGRPPEMNAAAAREAARPILAAGRRHATPPPPAPAPTLAAFVDVFWRHHAPRWKPATQVANRRMLDRVILPVLGESRLDRLTRADIIAWRDGLAARPGMANRAIPVLSALMVHAARLGHRPEHDNPCRGLPRYRRRRLDRILSPAELRRLANVLDGVASHLRDMAGVVRLMLLTGARVGEVTGLEWTWIDGPRARLPDSKTGPRTIYLPSAARSLLERRRAQIPGPLVFPRGPDSTWCQQQWTRFRDNARLADVRLHDLRHTYASLAVMAGYGLPVVGRLLGHACAESTERYVHLTEAHVGAAAARVSDALAEALASGEARHGAA